MLDFSTISPLRHSLASSLLILSCFMVSSFWYAPSLLSYEALALSSWFFRDSFSATRLVHLCSSCLRTRLSFSSFRVCFAYASCKCFSS